MTMDESLNIELGRFLLLLATLKPLKKLPGQERVMLKFKKNVCVEKK